MNRTLVCFAVAEEAAPFRKTASNRDGIDLMLTGMGAANAERAIRRALESARPQAVISAGFAGGLSPDMPRGAVLFCADGHFPWRDRLIAGGALEGRFHCAERVAVTAAEKALLRRRTGADAVEMESAVIRRICRENAVPGATIRVVSDAAGEDLPVDFNAFMTPALRIDFPKLLWFLIGHPGRIRGLMALQRQTREAARNLAALLGAVIPP